MVDEIRATGITCFLPISNNLDLFCISLHLLADGAEGEDSKIKVRISKWYGEKRYNMTLDKELFDQLTAKAKASPKLRINYDLRDSADDESQRMLNAIEPGTVIPVHRHPMTSEEVIVLRGKAQEVFFDDEGNETGSWLLIPGGDIPAIHVPRGQYHTCRSLESGTVIIEFKNTKYTPAGTEEL